MKRLLIAALLLTLLALPAAGHTGAPGILTLYDILNGRQPDTTPAPTATPIPTPTPAPSPSPTTATAAPDATRTTAPLFIAAPTPTPTPAPPPTANPNAAGSLQNPYTQAALAGVLQTGLLTPATLPGLYLSPGLIDMDTVYRIESAREGDGFFSRQGWFLTCRPCSPDTGELAGIETIELFLPK